MRVGISRQCLEAGHKKERARVSKHTDALAHTRGALKSFNQQRAPPLRRHLTNAVLLHQPNQLSPGQMGCAG
jgi:hypothetical protein